MNGGLGTDSDGNLYVAAFNQNRIRKISPAGKISTALPTATSGSIAAQLALPTWVTLDSANDLFYTWGGRPTLVSKFTAASGTSRPYAGGTACDNPGEGVAAVTSNFCPGAIATDGTGNLYATDFTNRRVRKVSAATGARDKRGGRGSLPD